MKIVWERDRSTVRDVYEALLERRKVAYTTVMTMMKILEQKKYLKKTLADRAYGGRASGSQCRQRWLDDRGRRPAQGPTGGASVTRAT